MTQRLLGFKYIRAYPNNLNIMSRNYNPYPFLVEGAQIIAHNNQHVDDNLMKYIFLFNNNFGYKYFELSNTDKSFEL